jgi:hypothetical protein
MLAVRSLLAHWPGVPAGLRRTLRDVDPRDPFALVESADLLAEVMHLDRDDACELVGVDDRVYQAVHDAWLDPRAPRQPHPSTTGAHHAG